MNKTTVTVSDGYRIFEEKSLYDFESVCKVLKEDDLKIISSAVIKEDKVEVVKKYWVCPVCGCKHYVKRNSSVSADGIEDKIFCPNLFYSSNVLIAECESLRKPIYVCEKCGSFVPVINKEYNFAVSCHNNIIKTELEIDDIESLLSTQILDGDITSLINEMPVYECLYLDLSKGNVTLQIENSKGDIFSKVNEITEIQALKSNRFFEMLFYCNGLKKIVVKAFSEAWGRIDFPFTEKDLDFELLFRLVKFINYPFSDFYYCIPYDETEINVFPTFKNIAEKTHRYDDLPKLFENSSLPKAKSLKRLLFTNPEYFFYFDELEKLWQLINDINLFMTVIKSEQIFYLLSQIHIYGKVFEYFDVFIKHNSIKSLCNLIVKDPLCFVLKALAYLGTADENKIYYETVFANKNFRLMEFNYYFFYHNKSLFNIPMARINDKIKNCTIDGYNFVALKSKYEYVQAGKQLKNCLVGWDCIDHPVVAIKKNNKIVGAVEINDSYIFQARGYDNSNIENTDFYSAFLKFCDKYSLSEPRFFKHLR